MGENPDVRIVGDQWDLIARDNASYPELSMAGMVVLAESLFPPKGGCPNIHMLRNKAWKRIPSRTWLEKSGGFRNVWKELCEVV